MELWRTALPHELDSLLLLLENKARLQVGTAGGMGEADACPEAMPMIRICSAGGEGHGC